MNRVKKAFRAKGIRLESDYEVQGVTSDYEVQGVTVDSEHAAVTIYALSCTFTLAMLRDGKIVERI